MNEFEKYATRHCGINSLKLHDFRSQYAAYVSPTIIEERQLNVATMDVFSRLMMDRIIFLGAPIEKIEKDADRDYWLSAREAKEYGLIDEVLTKRG